LTDVVESSAPGRVNLIGEHTDYNGGFVLPMAIPQRTYVELRRGSGREIVVHSAAMGAAASYVLGDETRGRGWVDYVQGVTYVLARAGHRLSGGELRIRSTVPVGSGLSSSAALSVATLRALRTAFSLELDDVQLALLAQKVETDFVGAPIGVMDQMASSLADERTALFLDTRSLHYEKVPLPTGVGVLVIDSGIQHSHATGDYRTRRRECEEAAAGLGVRQLRDATEGDLPRIDALPEPLSRRARHVVTENARVLEAVAAMRAGDAERLGALFNASHASMRDDFAVSTPEVDRLVALATATPGIFGARLTGGGFGGAIVALARIRDRTENGTAIVEAAQRAGLRPSLLV
jgi:galactokinase